MADESATVLGQCPSCGQEVEIDNRWTAGGVNDYGGYVLECSKCSTKYEFHLGRDINDSRVVSGAKVLGTYDDEVGDKAAVLKRYGL